MTNPIDPAAAAELTDQPSNAPAPERPAEHESMATSPSLASRTRTAGEARARRVASAVLDRIGTRTAAIVGDEVSGLRREIVRLEENLARTRGELTAEITLLRAELSSVSHANSVEKD